MTRNNNSWLVPLADLSLILFILTAATLAGTLGTTREEDARPNRPIGGIAQGVPAAVHLDYPGGPPLDEWLAQYAAGPGEQLTIQAYYRQGDRQAMVARAEELAGIAISAGLQPRMILQPSTQSQVMALFAHDGDPQVAQSLLRVGEK